jgi:hypothetical protein
MKNARSASCMTGRKFRCMHRSSSLEVIQCSQSLRLVGHPCISLVGFPHLFTRPWHYLILPYLIDRWPRESRHSLFLLDLTYAGVVEYAVAKSPGKIPWQQLQCAHSRREQRGFHYHCRLCQRAGGDTFSRTSTSVSGAVATVESNNKRVTQLPGRHASSGIRRNM